MEIKAQVRSVSKLAEYFFLVPDYQREYVWKAHDQVEQFLVDIEPDLDDDVKDFSSYFLGAIIIINNRDKWDVIDGQQRLTTLVLFMCALRNALEGLESDAQSDKVSKTVEALKRWLYDWDVATGESRPRLELQYEESSDYLTSLIDPAGDYNVVATDSVKSMKAAFEHMTNHLRDVKAIHGAKGLVKYVSYALTRLELVVIEAEELSSALKIFETINQRGAGLNAMDLVKNLLFSEAEEHEFEQIKLIWKEIIQNLSDCDEGDKPLRFLRYFITARYFESRVMGNGKREYLIREDHLYKWIISKEGKELTNYEDNPVAFAKELRDMSKRYSLLVQSTSALDEENNGFPELASIGFMNKFRSRSHLVLLMALHRDAEKDVINYLARQLESYFFITSSLGRHYGRLTEQLFGRLAKELRGKKTVEEVRAFVQAKIRPYLVKLLPEFIANFKTIRFDRYSPGYRKSFVLWRLENTLREMSGGYASMPLHAAMELDFEHIMPQTPRNGIIPSEFEDDTDYDVSLNMLGNFTLLESNINQALNKANDLSSNEWFNTKLREYSSSDVLSAKMMSRQFSVGVNTQTNRTKEELGYSFESWGKESILQRQAILLELALMTWSVDGERLDKVVLNPEEEADVEALD